MKGERRLSVRTKATIFVLLLLFLTGCFPLSGEKMEKRISDRLAGLNRYYAELNARIYSPEGEQSYRIRQWYEKPNIWRVEVESDTSEQIFICDGTQVFVYQPGLGDYYRVDIGDALDDIAPPFFLVGYLEQIVNADGFTYEGERSLDGKPYYAVTLDGFNRGESMRFWLDKRTWFPVQLETTLDGQLLNRITCTRLDLKPKFPEGLFSFTEPGEREVASHCLITPLTLDEAQSDWSHPLYIPEYLPPGTFLFVISRSEENGREQLAFIYKGEHPFSLVQGPDTGTPPFRAETTREVKIGSATGYYHPNRSGELSTLWWSNQTSTFILTGNISLNEMQKIAVSLHTQ
jgi:outer membrane lipoprotein-sorting protein